MTKDRETVAREASELFETRTRDDGSSFVTLTDEAPEWLRDAVYEAHDDELPDDWRYAAISSAVDAIADGADDAGEWADGEVDVYNADRLAWLSANLGRAGICDEACEELGGADTGMFERIGLGQYVTLSRVFSVMFDAIDGQAE